MEGPDCRERKVDAAEDFFTKARFAPFAQQAFKYVEERGLYYEFFGGAAFAPELTFYPSEGMTKPIFTMSGENDEGVTLYIGAMETQEELYGYCSVKQRYGGDDFCVVDIFFKDGEAAMFFVMVEGKDFRGRPLEVKFSYEKGSFEDRDEIFGLFAKFGLELRTRGKIDVKSMERLFLAGVKGRLSASGSVSVDEVMERLLDLLTQG